LFFTLQGNTASEKVIQELKEAFAEIGAERDVECAVFGNGEEVRARFESGISPLSAVVLYDTGVRRFFSQTVSTRHAEAGRIPPWSHGAQWVVKVSPRQIAHETKKASNNGGVSSTMRFRFAKTCALQLRADYWKRFHEQLGARRFPWGNPKRGEVAPQNVVLTPEVHAIRRKLNEGPNLAAVIAAHEYAVELPKDSRISWLRIPPEPLQCDETALRRVLDALTRFEEASASLLREKPEIRETLLAGVEIPMPSEFREYYLAGHVERFSVRRPDLHWTGKGVFASENDEMPGGFAESAHVDASYGVNQDRWQRCFTWLASEGPILFLVSHEWSKVYVPELSWLAARMKKLGFPAFFATTAELEELRVDGEGVRWKGEKIGTIWRQFPIFETAGKTAELVRAAAHGIVRMVPEFAHFGNKAWFSVFRREQEFFRGKVGVEAFDVLDQMLPDSHLVMGNTFSPCTVAGHRILSLEALKELPEEVRNSLVLKICGANVLASRSYGVLMGTGITRGTWVKWIEERFRLQQPFIVQRRLETGVAQLPVLNTKFERPELFGCRILFRPWMVGGMIVTGAGCAVPSNTLRVHGRVDMAVYPIVFV
jgi:hypothetical protein